MKKQNQLAFPLSRFLAFPFSRLTLFLFLAAWSSVSPTQAASPGMVATWGENSWKNTVPLLAQNGVTAIAGGGAHTVALKEDGSVVAWGFSYAPTGTVVFPADSGVIAIAAGEAHTVVLKNDGSVAAWGYNHAGQTDGPAAAQSGVIAIAAGELHTVALKNDGTVIAWGENGLGQLTGTPTGAFSTASPVTIGGEVLSGVTAIAAGGGHTMALKNDGSVVGWGYYGSGTTTVPIAARSGVKAIAAGYFHAVALKNDGSVVTWGNGPTNVPVAAQSGVAAIAAGYWHTVALKNDGSVVVWGDNEYGQSTAPPGLRKITAIAGGGTFTVVLGTPTAPAILVPPASQAAYVWQNPGFTVTATGFPLFYQWQKDGVDLAGGTNASYLLGLVQAQDAGSYTVVVSNAIGSVTSAPAELSVNSNTVGTVVVWGTDLSGLANVPVAAQSEVTAISAGSSHLVALKNDGSVVTWGENEYGQTMMPVTAQGGVIAIAAGGLHSLALKNDGSLVAWGAVTNADKGDWFDFGQTRVPVAAQSGVTAIAAGFYHSVVLKNGSVIAWGAGTRDAASFTNSGDNYGHYGQSLVPTSAQSGVTAIAAGWLHTVALKNDGSVIAWGDNRSGATNVPVAAQSGVMAISAGNGHTVALKNDGTIVAWGFNRYGGVTGTPTTASPYIATASPVTLAGEVLTGVSAIAAGSAHTVALKNDGTVEEWGYSDGRTPVPNGLSGVTAIADGNPYSVALVGAVPLLPSLTARSSEGQLTLSWPTNAIGFTLQSTLSLTPPATWFDLNNAPALIGGKWTVTSSLSGSNKFYRLSKP